MNIEVDEESYLRLDLNKDNLQLGNEAEKQKQDDQNNLELNATERKRQSK